MLFLSNTSDNELLKYMKLLFILNKRENLCFGGRKVFRIYLKEYCLQIQLIVSFNFGLDHQFKLCNPSDVRLYR